MDRRPGCLTGLFELFFLRAGYGWAQRNVGFGRGGCSGCGCGFILLILFVFILFSILFGTNWTHLGQIIPSFMMMV